MHRCRYNALSAADGRGGKVDLGSRKVDDHDVRRTLVAVGMSEPEHHEMKRMTRILDLVTYV